MIPGLPGNVFLCGKIFCWESEALLRAGGQQACTAIGTGSGQKAAAGNSAKQGSAKHKGDSPLEERWSFGAFTTGVPKAVRSLAQGVQSYIHNCDTYIAAPFR